MNSSAITERVLRHLLRESEERTASLTQKRLEQGRNMALTVKDNGSSIVAVLYSPAALIRLADKVTASLDDAKDLVEQHIMLGVINIVKTHNPCNGAWEVKQSAVKNPGDGGVLYDIAFGLADGPLTSDRRSVSPSAQRGWAGVKKSRGGKPFDDIRNPQTPDKSDDCEVHKNGDVCKSHVDIDALNRSYEARGGEAALIGQLKAVHDKAMDMLTPKQAKMIEYALHEFSNDFFVTHYNRDYFASLKR
jgi:hypothetical protein